MKNEKTYIKEYNGPKALRKDIADFIREYNEVRQHEAISYTTPRQRFSECFGNTA